MEFCSHLNEEERWDDYHELHRLVIQNDVTGILEYISSNKDLNVRDENVSCLSVITEAVKL